MIKAALHPYDEDLVIVSNVGYRRTGSGTHAPAQRPTFFVNRVRHDGPYDTDTLRAVFWAARG